MENETLKDISAYIVWFGSALILIGTIGFHIYSKKDEKKKLKNFSQYINWSGSALILLGSIGLQIFSNKIEEYEKKSREKIEKINIELSEKILDQNMFYAEIDERIEGIDLIIKLKQEYKVRDLDHFECFIKMDYLERQYRFKYTTYKRGGYIIANEESQSVVNSGWDNTENLSILSGLKSNPNHVILELFPVLIRGNYPNLKIRDLHKSSFQLALTKKHSKMIDTFVLNANNWNIYGRSPGSKNWKDVKTDWFDKSLNEYSIYYRAIDERHYEDNIIDLYEKSAVRHNVNKFSLISTNPGGKESLDDLFKKTNPKEGSLGLTLGNKWLEKNGKVIYYLKPFKKDNFKIFVLRDYDNILKVFISTEYFSNEELICKDFDQFSYDQKFHDTMITWSESSLNFYINGNLVDKKIRQY
jgi:hypothetical protein